MGRPTYFNYPSRISNVVFESVLVRVGNTSVRMRVLVHEVHRSQLRAIGEDAARRAVGDDAVRL